MPRKPRTKSETNIYHVVIRGADRQQMFEDKNDYLKYLDIFHRILYSKRHKAKEESPCIL